MHLIKINNKIFFFSEEVNVCDGLNVTLQCEENKIINFTMANYGRFAIEVCNDPNDFKIPDEKLCKNDKTLPILEKRCEGQSICSFNVNAEMFEDGCIGSPRYLVARYNCIDKIIPTTTEKIENGIPHVNIHLMEESEYARIVSQGANTAVINGDKNKISISVVAKVEETKETSKICPKENKRLITWPQTESGKKVRVDCPVGSHGLAEWYCTKDGKWDPPTGPNLIYCKSIAIVNLAEDLDDIDLTDSKAEIKKSIETMLEDTVKLLKNHVTVFGGDIIVIDGIISKINEEFQFLDEDPESASIIVDRVSDVLDVLLKSTNEFWYDLNIELRRKLLFKMLESYEKMLLKILVPSTKKNVANSKTISKNNFFALSSEVLKHNSVKYPSNTNQNYNDNVIISDSVIDGNIDTITFVSYNKNISKILVNDISEEDIFLTNIISVSLQNGKQKILRINNDQKNSTHPFVISLQLQNKLHPMKSAECINYDEEQGSWTSENCILSSITNHEVICHCSVLGKISVIMNDNKIDMIEPLQSNDYIQLIIIISCVIGIFFMTMSLFSIFVFYSTTYSNKGQTIILRNITFTYIISNILILVFFAAPNLIIDTTICSLFTIFTQFFILSFILWIIIMCYQLIVEISQDYTGPNNLALFLYNTIAYVLPLFISFGSAYWYQSSIGIDSWRVSEFCFNPSNKNLLIGYGVPIALLIVMNAFVSIILLYTIYKHNNEGYRPCKQEISSNLKNIKIMTKGIIASGILTSICLVSIHFYIEGRNSIFIYISCAFNILLSLFFFVYFVVISETMAFNYNQWVLRNEWLPDFIRDLGDKNLENNSHKMILSREGETPVLFTEPFSNNLSPAHFSFSPSCMSTYTYSGDKSLLCSQYKSHVTPNFTYQQNPSPFNAHNNNIKGGTTYDYPSMAFDKTNFGGTFSTNNTLLHNNKNRYQFGEHQNGHSFVFPVESISPCMRTTPPKFPPPPPPQVNGSSTLQYKLNQTPVTMSEDSAYSDSGSSTFQPPVISNGVPLIANYTSGSMVLRMDLNKNPPVFLNGNN
uniref:G_PROTEIN_RECEP_F2_3 domain-containing protein n=1 Tax=Parastrongyloides trichosuri TaxID=131310 RepID=A0A0N4ZAU9_PARTI